MKILFLCHRFPYPADGGGKIRALKMIEHLGARHEVHVVSMLRDDAEAAGASGLASLCTGFEAPRVGRVGPLLRMAASVARGRSLSEGYFGAPAVRDAVRRLLATHDFDWIVVHCSAMGPYVEDVRDVPKLLDFCDVDSQKWRMFADQARGPRRWLYRYEQHAVARLERRLADRFEVSAVVTAAELDALLEVAAPRRAAWYPNGVDLAYFRPLREHYDASMLCFVGRMDYLPNIECVTRFCRDVWPLVTAERPEARFVIVGAAPSEAVVALAALPGVEVTGTVDDVRRVLGRAAAMVAPLRIARGMQNKILEAMAMGVPVITSGLAARGVDAVVPDDLLACDEPADIAAASLRCMTTPDFRRRLSVRGRRLVRRRYAWKHCLARLDALLPAPVRP